MMVKSVCIILIIFITFLTSLHAQVENSSQNIPKKGHFSLPVDITFLIADLKYNSEQGVKICEIQPGSMSGFYCKFPIPPEVDFSYGPDGELEDTFCNFLSQYITHFWLIDAPIDSTFKQKLIANGWIQMAACNQLNNDSLFERISKMLPRDPYRIDNYFGIVYASYHKLEKEVVDEFLQSNPGIILLDASIYPYVNNKLAISEFLSMNEKSRNLKPRWKSYSKQYSKTLAETIIEDLYCEFYVIKPINALKGRGVIITHKNDLNSNLELILDHKKLSKGLYADYSALKYWNEDLNEVFIVEEFIESDPVRVAHLGNQIFDGTMRVAFFLTYNQEEVQIYFVGQEWQLPERALTAKGTMTQKHKSSVRDSNFAGVDIETCQKVQEQLREGLLIFYKQILGVN